MHADRRAGCLIACAALLVLGACDGAGPAPARLGLWRSALTVSETPIVPSDVAASDFYGYVAIDGNTMVSGAYLDDDKGNGSGSAYVYVRGANGKWTLQQKLTASDGKMGDQLGRGVAIQGDTIALGAPGRDSSRGAIYVFVRSGTSWTEQQTLTTTGAAINDYFGFSVAVDGDTIVGGAWGADEAQYDDHGAAYVYTRSSGSWTFRKKLVPADAVKSSWFGQSVAVSNNTLLIGAPGDDDKGGKAGAAYVYTGSGANWSLQKKLVASDGSSGATAGNWVAIDGDTALVCASGDKGAGAAYVFDRASGVWSETTKLSTGISGQELGRAAGIDGSLIIVGAARDDHAGANTGAAYLFSKVSGSWSQQKRLTASNAAGGDLYGAWVDVSGNYAVVGAYLKGGGASYIYEITQSTPDAGPADSAADVARSDAAADDVAAVVDGRAYDQTVPPDLAAADVGAENGPSGGGGCSCDGAASAAAPSGSLALLLLLLSLVAWRRRRARG